MSTNMTWSWSALLVCGLTVASPCTTQAKDFRCGSGDVACLINAINEANGNGKKNTIRLAAGTYALTSVNNTTDGPNGLPSITGKVILQGAGAEATRLERVFTTLDPCGPGFGSPPVEAEFRLLHVAPAGELTLKGVTLRGGCSPFLAGGNPGGGALLVRGKAELSKNAVVENMSDHSLGGGAINNGGHLKVSQSAILLNMTLRSPGAAIFNAGVATLRETTIGDNLVIDGSAGGVWSDGTLTVTRSRIMRNIADNIGGLASTGHAVIESSSLEENVGTIAFGAILNVGRMDILDSTIARNASDWVGGIGNALVGSTLTVTNTSITENEAFFTSGGIDNEAGSVTLINSTITRNRHLDPSGPIFAGTSAGLGNRQPFSTDPVGAVTVVNTILAQNALTAPAPTSSGGPDCGGPITSLGTNLVGDPTGCGIALQVGDRTGDPGLGDFVDNGTPGNGHVPLLATSQAIDAANDAVCPKRDQLGQRRVNIPRVGGSRCDIGSIEFPGH